jgi:hypothetical protein
MSDRVIGVDPGIAGPLARSSPLVAEDPDAERFESLELFAEKARSLWLSVGEASFRSDREALAVHCRQIAALTKGVFVTVKALGSDARGAHETAQR